ncbi:hypothetical protein ON010_g17380 [Phytophthora cinnamomi]|nr:hypothetical protein ON010_g17380 [Phytophthora cinnamomi]
MLRIARFGAASVCVWHTISASGVTSTWDEYYERARPDMRAILLHRVERMAIQYVESKLWSGKASRKALGLRRMHRYRGRLMHPPPRSAWHPDAKPQDCALILSNCTSINGSTDGRDAKSKIEDEDAGGGNCTEITLRDHNAVVMHAQLSHLVCTCTIRFSNLIESVVVNFFNMSSVPAACFDRQTFDDACCREILLLYLFGLVSQ